MILLKIYKDSVSHHELLTQYQNINDIYNGHMNWILWMFGIGITVVGILLPIFIAYIQNRSFDKELERLKVDLKNEIEEKYNKKVKEKTDELEQTIEELKEKVKKEDDYLQYKLDIPIKMLEGYILTKEFKYNDAFEILIEALYYAFKLNNQYYIESVNNRINNVISNYRENINTLSSMITIDKISQSFTDIIFNEEDKNIRNKMENYISSYRREIEEINNKQKKS